MIGILWYFLANVAIYLVVQSIDHPEAYPWIKVIGSCISIIWGAALLSSIADDIRQQIKESNKIDEYKTKKITYEKELSKYKEEMQTELLEKYRTFEETIIKSISDSKLLASVMKETNYSSVLKQYDNRIKYYLSEIESCERKIAEIIVSLKTRQDNIFSCGIFIPNKYRFKENKDG